jgi:hypothetical protein
VAGPYDADTATIIASSSIVGPALWEDRASFPSDPDAANNGLGSAIVFALGGAGWTAPSNLWRMDFISPALPDDSPFQNRRSVTFAVLDHSGGSAPALNAQLIYQVEKCDGSTSYFRQVSGGSTVFCRTTYGTWTTCRFDLTIPAIRRVKTLQIRLFGSTQAPYEGTVDMDVVHAL